MGYIETDNRNPDHLAILMRRTLDSISGNFIPQQLPYLLDGYADLLKIIIKIIHFEDNVSITNDQVSTFSGTSTANEQQEYQHVVFIMFNVKQNLFASLYVDYGYGHVQTRFHNDDELILNAVTDFIDRWHPKSKSKNVKYFIYYFAFFRKSKKFSTRNSLYL
jgi:hypothetical protein